MITSGLRDVFSCMEMRSSAPEVHVGADVPLLTQTVRARKILYNKCTVYLYFYKYIHQKVHG